MNEPAAWIENNERHLGTMLAWLCLSLEATSQAGERDSPADQANLARLRQEMLELEQLARPPALTLLSRALGLSEFECRVLALCAAMELDTRIPNLCAAAQRDDARPYPSFALAFALWPDAQWNAVSPHGALRYWRLLEISQPNALPLTAAALALDERILNYLKGVNYLDDRLTPLLDPVAPGADGASLTRSQQQAVERIVSGLGQCNQAGPTPVVELSGHDGASMRLVASSAAAALGLNLQVLHVSMLPAGNGDQETFARLWQRESLLMPLALYVETAGATEVERSRLARFLRRSNGVVFIEGSSGDIGNARGRITLPIGKPVPAEQAQLWASALPDGQAELARLLSEQFSFNAEEITRLVTAAEIMDDAGGRESALWQACRGQSRTGLNQLAQRIDARARWDELVLPPEQKSLLRAITDQVGQRSRVYRDWGFGQRLNRGLGINALFSGESGTGKSMAAEVIANELELDLYRIDLSAVVNKYIGETEKNLRKLFDAAEESGAILFFDEADALFGKRSEVKDSHDRYANIEINYLLQRMESYRGLAVLATNRKGSLDKAFMRRLRFIVEFPFPASAERTEIWRRVFPSQTPLAEDFDTDRLAQLNLTGGNIHNIALNAAFLAARQDSPVTMPLLLDAARAEYRKLDRPSKESDFAWQHPLEAAI